MPLPSHIIKSIQSHTQGTFKLDSCGLYDQEIDEVVKLINLNPNITALSLEDNNLQNGAASSLLSLSHVTRLFVANNSIGNDGALCLIQSEQFITLDLSKNYLINDSIVPSILKHSTQTCLIIRNTSISQKSIDLIREKISQNLKHYDGSKKLNLDKKNENTTIDPKNNSASPAFFSKSTDKNDSQETQSNKTTPSSSIITKN